MCSKVLCSVSYIVLVVHVFFTPNENKMSDGWREGASLRIEGRISWKIKNQNCQAFAPSFG